KINPAGSALLYSTYLGGSGTEGGGSIAVDAAGNAYVTGNTGSTNFPTLNPIQATNQGSNGAVNAIIAEVNATGSALAFSTYLGGGGGEGGKAIALDAAGTTYVTGSTSSPNFQAPPGPLQPPAD